LNLLYIFLVFLYSIPAFSLDFINNDSFDHLLRCDGVSLALGKKNNELIFEEPISEKTLTFEVKSYNYEYVIGNSIGEVAEFKCFQIKAETNIGTLYFGQTIDGSQKPLKNYCDYSHFVFYGKNQEYISNSYCKVFYDNIISKFPKKETSD
jgi:hypothetical protein